MNEFTLVLGPSTPVTAATTRQIAVDQQLIDLWLHGRSPHTQRAYRADVARFLAFVATPLPTVTLGDLQAFADALAQQAFAPSSRVRTLAAIKALLAFGQRTGYLPLNVGAALKLPPKKDRLAERILSETQVHRLLALEPSKRNQA
ncbi:MAG: tyrosine-type recombinase/integrase, partial [Acidimicrobiales bacterium]